MISEFRTKKCIEYYVTLELTEIRHSFKEIVNSTFLKFNKLCKEKNLDDEALIYIKIYLSDISNQSDYVKAYLKENHPSCFYMLVGQPPASGAKFAIEAYFYKAINGLSVEKYSSENKASIKRGPYLTTWGSLTTDRCGDSYEQSKDLLSQLSMELKTLMGNIKDNILRTWFYIRDIDNNYDGMVKCRKKWFEKENMTKDTHFIASTGIEGNCVFPSTLVELSYISSFGLLDDQVVFMSAPQNMNPTHEYGVTFERGTKVIYGDRSHYYISGTASIDNMGSVLFLNDVIKQIERIFINIEALLKGYNAELSDLKMMVVYLRDFSEYAVVNNYLKERFKDCIPYIIVNAPVCRQEWLIEIEGIAINKDKNINVECY